MGKTIARSLISELSCTSLSREVLVVYSTDSDFYLGNQRYEHGSYALNEQRRIYDYKRRDRKVGYWWS